MITLNKAGNSKDVLNVNEIDGYELDEESEIMSIVNEFSTQKTFVNDPDSLESLLHTIDRRLQLEESLSAVLYVMRASQSCLTTNESSVVGHAAAAKNEYHMTMEVARKLLDHQFMTRQKMIHSQMEKALYDISATRQTYQVDNSFIPSLGSDFLPLMGLSEVVDSLKDGLSDSSADVHWDGSMTCNKCGTGAAPAWKKRKINDEILCSACNDADYHCNVRRQYEDKIVRMKLQFEDQEKNLIRDYNDMLSSPRKLELFRVEQEKKQRIQSLSNKNPQRAIINLFRTNSQKSPPITEVQQSDLPPSCPINLPMMQSQMLNEVVHQKSEVEVSQSTSAYAQIMQTLVTHSQNSNTKVDQENVRKLQQVLVLLHSNPLLANNNAAVLKLLSSVCGTEGTSTSDTVAMLNHFITAATPSTDEVATSK